MPSFIKVKHKLNQSTCLGPVGFLWSCRIFFGKRNDLVKKIQTWSNIRSCLLCTHLNYNLLILGIYQHTNVLWVHSYATITLLNFFNHSAVVGVIKLFLKVNPSATMIIHSTISVGYPLNVQEKYHTDNTLFSPEFLHESNTPYNNFYLSRM